MFGDPETIGRAIPILSDQLDLGWPILDETHDRDLGYRLVVFQLAAAGQGPKQLEADVLSVHQGRIDGSDVVVDAGAPSDFVTYGPYVQLDPGRYRVSLAYSSGAPATQTAGSFDAFTVTRDTVAALDLPGTDSGPGEVSLEFEVSDRFDYWEFRTRTTGVADLRIDRITLLELD